MGQSLASQLKAGGPKNRTDGERGKASAEIKKVETTKLFCNAIPAVLKRDVDMIERLAVDRKGKGMLGALVTEALEDLVEKYRRKEGNYKFEEVELLKWEKQ